MTAASQVVQIIISVAIGAWLGWALDAKLGWSNVLQLLLPGLGFIASLTLVYRAFCELKNNMTNHRLILRDALLVLPVLVAVGFWVDGAWLASGVLASGIVTVVNLWVIMMLTYRLTAALETQNGQLPLIGVLGLVKVPVVMAVYTLIAQTFGLMAAFLGILVLMAPVCIRGIQYLAQTTIPSDEMEVGDLDGTRGWLFMVSSYSRRCG